MLINILEELSAVCVVQLRRKAVSRVCLCASRANISMYSCRRYCQTGRITSVYNSNRELRSYYKYYFTHICSTQYYTFDLLFIRNVSRSAEGVA